MLIYLRKAKMWTRKLKHLLNGVLVLWAILVGHVNTVSADSPLIGTYEVEYIAYPGLKTVLRVFPDGKAERDKYGRFKWSRHGEVYEFYFVPMGKEQADRTPSYAVVIDPETSSLITATEVKNLKHQIAARKISVSPEEHFDLFELASRKNLDRYECFNIGSKNFPSYREPLQAPPTHASTLAGCKALCPAVVKYRLANGWPVSPCPITAPVYGAGPN